jgi:hypothetical protein
MISAPAVPTTDDRVRSEVADAAGRCPACPHATADHDAISLRYCSASQAIGTSSRGCVCPKP